MRSVLTKIVGRIAGSYPGRLVQVFGRSHAGQYASGLAFTSFVSMFPLILGLLAILGLATSDPSVRTQFLNATLVFFPPDAHAAITSALDGVRHNSGVLAVVSILGLLWSGSSLFTGMEYALGQMVGARQREFLRQRAMTLVMTLIFAVSVVATIFVNGALAVLGSLPALEPVVGLGIWLAFMAAVYRFVPNRTYQLRQLWPGVVLAALLTEGLSLLWPLYGRLSHGFNTYGLTFALFFLLAAWLYFLAQFILLGAVVNRMHTGTPEVPGLIGEHDPQPLVTDATRAADELGRDRRRAPQPSAAGFPQLPADSVDR